MKETAHLRITAQEAKELYLSGLFTTHAYLYILVRTLRKDGWWLYFNSVTEFCQEWGIHERAFYRAKAILISQGYLEETIKGKLGLRCPVKEDQEATDLTEVSVTCQKCHDKNVRDLSKVSGDMTKMSGNMTKVSGETDKSVSDASLKPAPGKDSTFPTDLDQIYTTYIHREEDGLNANNHGMDLDMDNIGSRDPMDLRDPELDEPDPTWDPDPTRDPGSNPTMDPDPTGDPGSKFTQPAPSHLHKETMGGLGSNSMNGNSLSSRLDVKQILEETKRKLMEQVQWQRSQRMQRWATNVLPVGTQGSSLTPGLSDRGMTTTSTFRSSVKPVMRHLG